MLRQAQLSVAALTLCACAHSDVPPTTVLVAPATAHCDYAIASYIFGDCAEGDRHLALCRARVARFDDTPWPEATRDHARRCPTIRAHQTDDASGFARWSAIP